MIAGTLPRAFAGNIWDGGGASGNWSDAANWNGDAYPTTGGGALNFRGTTRTTNSNDKFTTSDTFSTISFTTSPGAFVIGGNAISLSTSIVNNAGSASTQTINLGLNLTSTVTVTSTSSSMVLGGDLTGSGLLLSASTGQTLTLNGNNSHAGGTRAYAGTLLLGSNTAAGTGTLQLANQSGSADAAVLTNGAVTISNGVTIKTGSSGTATLGGNTAAASTFSGGITLERDLIVSAAAGGTVSFTNALTGTTAKVSKDGAGAVVLAGTNTYKGATTINTGTLQLGNGGTTGTLSIDSAITNNSALTINRSNAVAQGTDFSGAAITGTGELIKLGAGSLTLNATNTYGGATQVNAGSLILTSAGTIASTAYTIATDATFNVSAKTTYTLASVATTIGVGATTAGYFNGPSGALTLGNSLTLNFSTSLLADGQTYDLFNFGSQTGQFTTIGLTGSITGSLNYTGVDLWTGSAGGYNFTFDEAAGVLSVASAVPEPSSYAVLAGILIMGVVVCKRRHRS